MIVYSEHYDELGVLTEDGVLIQFSDEAFLKKVYLPELWIIIDGAL